MKKTKTQKTPAELLKPFTAKARKHEPANELHGVMYANVAQTNVLNKNETEQHAIATDRHVLAYIHSYDKIYSKEMNVMTKADIEENNITFWNTAFSSANIAGAGFDLLHRETVEGNRNTGRYMLVDDEAISPDDLLHLATLAKLINEHDYNQNPNVPTTLAIFEEVDHNKRGYLRGLNYPENRYFPINPVPNTLIDTAVSAEFLIKTANLFKEYDCYRINISRTFATEHTKSETNYRNVPILFTGTGYSQNQKHNIFVMVLPYRLKK